MILIKKSKEPSAWCQYRQTPGAPFRATKELKDSLLREQGYLCAYCMQRIRLDRMKVEHYHCRSRYPEEVFVYTNLFACCCGNTGGELHCDTSKGNQELTFSPLRCECIDSLSYKSNGEIVSSQECWDEELNVILHLNTDVLKENRKKRMQALVEGLKGMQFQARAMKQRLHQLLSLGTGGELKEYCGIEIYYLQRRLSKLGSHR